MVCLSKDFADYLLADAKIRQFLHKKLRQAAISRIVIERAWNSLRVTIHTARPGVVIGRGSEIEKMTEEISRLAGGKQVKLISSKSKPRISRRSWSPKMWPRNLSGAFLRRAMKRAVQLAMEQGALGIKIRSSGALEARRSHARSGIEGMIPLHTMRQPIDYGFAEASTVAGKIGVKCWICKKPPHPEGEEQKQEQSRIVIALLEGISQPLNLRRNNHAFDA